MRNYELVWIIGGDSTDDEAVSSVSAMSDLVEQGGGQVIHTESWGHRSLAYKIKQNVTHTAPEDIDAVPADQGRQRSGPRR